VSGAVDFQPFNAVKLLEDIAVDYQAKDSKALTSVAFKSKFKADLKQFSLSEIQLIFDQSEMLGWFSLNDFEQPAINFALQLDNLNLDNYLPGSSQVADKQVKASDAAALAIPMVLLKGVNANGSFKANQLISGGMQLDQVDVQIVSSPGSITVTPKAALYQGALGGTMIYTEQGDESTLQVKNSIDLISLSEFLQAADVSKQLSGIGTLKLDLQVNEKNGVQRRQGTIKLLANNGVLKGFDFKDKLEQVYASLKQPAAQTSETAEGDSDQGEQTQFADLLGTFHLADNLLSNQDFELHAPLFRVKGQGTIDIAKEQIDYQLTLFAKGGVSGVSQEFAKLEGIPIPIRLRGSLYAPRYSLDLNALLKALAKHKISEQKSAYLKEKLGVEGGGELSTKEILQQLLIDKANKRADRKQAQQSKAGDTSINASSEQPPKAQPYQQNPNSQPEDKQQASKPEPTKKELRDERNRRLLELLLGGSEQDGDE
jgi:AsmA protein